MLRHLFNDFPSEHSTVRVVLLLQIFLAEAPLQYQGTNPALILTDYVRTCKERIIAAGLAPVKRIDLLEVLANKFAPDRFQGILEYGKAVMDMSKGEIEGLLQEVAIRCLETGCKGKMLKKLMETHPWLDDVIRARVMKHLRLNVDDLPHWEDDEGCAAYNAPLSRNFMTDCDFGFAVSPILPQQPSTSHHVQHGRGTGNGDDGEDEDSEDEDLVSTPLRVLVMSVVPGSPNTTFLYMFVF